MYMCLQNKKYEKYLYLLFILCLVTLLFISQSIKNKNVCIYLNLMLNISSKPYRFWDCSYLSLTERVGILHTLQ